MSIVPVHPAAALKTSRYTLVLPGLIIAGMIGMTVQACVLRELLAVCRGGEFIIGVVLLSWLLWTAFGSGPLAALVLRRVGTARLFHGLVAVYGLLGYLSVTLFTGAPLIFRLLPGEAIPYDVQFLAAALFTAPFNIAGGMLFPLGVRALESTDDQSSGRAFTAEASGAALGGLLFSAILVHMLPNHAIALACPAAGVLWYGSTAFMHRDSTAMKVIPAILAAAAGIHMFGSAAAVYPYRGQSLIEERDTPFGRLRLTRTGEQVTFSSDTSILFSSPDPEHAEYSVHIPMLAAHSRKQVLILGGGPGGAAEEALKYRDLSRLTMVELDPSVFSLARTYLGENFPRDPRIETTASDPRAFLLRSKERFDVIVMTAPAPLSGLANRSYTRDFFRLASSRMTPDGIIGFSLEGSENYIGDDLARFLSSIRAELWAAFPAVAVLPGLECRFLASNRPGALDGLGWERLEKERVRLGIETSYVRDWFLRYIMSRERVGALVSSLDAVEHPPSNTDARPAGYLARTMLQGTLDNSRVIRALGVFADQRTLIPTLIVFSAAALLLLIPLGSHARGRSAAGLVFISGFAGISFTVISIMAYQSFFGYLYGRLAFLTGSFMAGLALGGWTGMRWTAYKDDMYRIMPVVQVGIALTAILWTFLIGQGARPFSEPAFFVLASLSGLSGGILFPVADHVRRNTGETASSSAGRLYASDLAGSSIGALLTGTLLVPGIGMVPALLFIAGLNVLAAGIAWLPRR